MHDVRIAHLRTIVHTAAFSSQRTFSRLGLNQSDKRMRPPRISAARVILCTVQGHVCASYVTELDQDVRAAQLTQ